MRRHCFALVWAAVVWVAAAAAAPAWAQQHKQLRAGLPMTATEIGIDTPEEYNLFQQVLQAATGASEAVLQGCNLVPGQQVVAAAAPANVSAAAVKSMFSKVLLAATIQEQIETTLGAPDVWEYEDGSRHALYRLPQQGTKRGTCVFVHGCKHDPESWFYKSEACPDCMGLPEEVAHTKQCLARGYAVLALASKNREYKGRCFSSAGDLEKSDQPDSEKVIKAWTKKFNLDEKPIYMFGVSSGGAFAIKFPMVMKIDGVVSEVNMVWEKNWGATYGDGVLKDPSRWPPVAYYMMEKDPQTEWQIEKALEIFEKNGVPADVVVSPAREVNPLYFHKRSAYITREQSIRIVSALKRIGVLNEDGFVQYDVRFQRVWVKQLPILLPWLTKDSPYYNLISDESQIFEALNVAYSQHEIIGDYVRPTLIWLESKGKLDLNQLVQQYSLDGWLSCLREWREGCPGVEAALPPSPPPPRPPPPVVRRKPLHRPVKPKVAKSTSPKVKTSKPKPKAIPKPKPKPTPKTKAAPAKQRPMGRRDKQPQ